MRILGKLIDNFFLKKFENTMKDIGFLGNTFLADKGKTIKTLIDLENIPLIALYFCADWCPPCKIFTPKLSNFYHEVNKDSKRVEIILISCDLDRPEFLTHIQKISFLSVPFDKSRSRAITERFDIAQIPTLTIIKWDGSVIKKNARDDVRDLGVDSFAKWVGMMIKEETICTNESKLEFEESLQIGFDDDEVVSSFRER